MLTFREAYTFLAGTKKRRYFEKYLCGFFSPHTMQVFQFFKTYFFSSFTQKTESHTGLD